MSLTRGRVDRVYAPGPIIEELYGIFPDKLKSLRRARKITSVRAGHRTVLYSIASVERYLKSRALPALGEREAGT